MPDDAVSFLLQLGLRDPEDGASILDDYLRHVANGGLTRYKTIIQTGAKAGQPLYVHVLNGVLTAARIGPVLGLSPIETRVLFSAYSVHDINKTVDNGGVSFNHNASPERIQAELERVGVPAFFPDYIQYLQDMTLLVRRHSAHYAVGGEFLVLDRNPYTLPRDGTCQGF